MEADPYPAGPHQSVDSQLRRVRRKLDQLAHYRASTGLSEADLLQYQSLCEQERDLLRQWVR
jgi:hypothetical protein